MRRRTRCLPEHVCIEKFIRIDLVRESLNVGHDGRADWAELVASGRGRQRNKSELEVDDRRSLERPCSSRKSYPHIAMVQSGKNWRGDDRSAGYARPAFLDRPSPILVCPT